MSDELLRDLQRRANSPTEKAVLLHKRLRYGQINADRIKLAAALGDEAALQVVSAPPICWDIHADKKTLRKKLAYIKSLLRPLPITPILCSTAYFALQLKKIVDKSPDAMWLIRFATYNNNFNGAYNATYHAFTKNILDYLTNDGKDGKDSKRSAVVAAARDLRTDRNNLSLRRVETLADIAYEVFSGYNHLGAFVRLLASKFLMSLTFNKEEQQKELTQLLTEWALEGSWSYKPKGDVHVDL